MVDGLVQFIKACQREASGWISRTVQHDLSTFGFRLLTLEHIQVLMLTINKG